MSQDRERERQRETLTSRDPEQVRWLAGRATSPAEVSPVFALMPTFLFLCQAGCPHPPIYPVL